MVLVAAHALLDVRPTSAAEVDLQLRVAWGGGAERQWVGSVALSQGSLALHRPLGIEADEPGSMWVDGNQLEFRQRSPRAYDGVDVFVTAPLDAILVVTLKPEGPDSAPIISEVRLGDLVTKALNRPLDDRNNRLLVRRAPGDLLRVRFSRDSLVFTPGEQIKLDLKPHLMPLAEGATVRIKARVIAKPSSDEQWSHDLSVTRASIDSTSPKILSFDLAAPASEGVYEFVIEAGERNPLRWNKPIATRQIQFVVVDDQPTRPTVLRPAAWTKVMEIEPATPGWTDRLKNWPLIPAWRQGPLGNGLAQTWNHPLGPLMQLGSTSRASDIAWEAYPLAINRPGTPHVLEVEYPSDVAQTLGISILEPNAAGTVGPIGLDSGFYVSDEAAQTAPRWERHRLTFWPRTKSPVLLMTNRRDGTPAAYGKLRVFSGPAELPPAFHPAFDHSERLFAAYLARPLFNENFSAAEALDPWSGRCLDGWETFYDGSSRLVEYLEHAGYNGLMLAVLADGSTIYPSNLLEPTPRYDSGAFFDSGQDPYRKDVLELLLRLFDRENQKLVPLVQFAAPLPALETLARQTNSQQAGIRLVGPDGKTWTESNAPRRGLAPYYNPLNPQVQQAMLAVVAELVDRYAHHPAFSGLAIELSAEGYAQLPGEAWGFDDDTVKRFARETKIEVPGKGVNRFAQRAEFLLTTERKAWLEWRARELAAFHQRLHQAIANVRSDALFYLAPVNLFDAPESQRELRPGLPPQSRMNEVLLGMGIQAEHYPDAKGLVFLRPRRFSPPGPIAAHAIDVELDHSAELDAMSTQSGAGAALFLHEPQKARLPSFDAKSPFGKDKTSASLVSELSPAGRQNRQRFIHSLAVLDSEAMFDGGWLLPLGQEEALANLIAAYRRLPIGEYESLGASDPVTIRTLVRDRTTYAHFVNDSAWPVTLTLGVALPRGIRPEELSGTRQLPPIVGGKWTLELAPYDLIAVRFAARDVKLSEPVATPPERALVALRQRIDDLRHRRAVLENATSLPTLANASFEQSASGGPLHWSLEPADARGVAAPDFSGPKDGKSSLRLASEAALVTLRSDPVPAPHTGRLSLRVFLRVADPQAQPQLRLAIESAGGPVEYHRYALVGRDSGVAPITSHWSEYVLKIDDLPASGIPQLRVRFDLIGTGEVWIDHVQLLDLDFDPKERLALEKMLALASHQLEVKGNWGECLRELDGYWPRFLMANVPLVQQPVVTSSTRSTPQPAEKQATRPGMLDRVRDWWRR